MSKSSKILKTKILILNLYMCTLQKSLVLGNSLTRPFRSLTWR